MSSESESNKLNDQQRMQDLAAAWMRSQPAVAAFISAMVPDYHQAEDILQTVSVVLVQKYHQYDPTQNFTAWAIGIARYEVLKSRRNVSRDKHQFAPEVINRLVESVDRQEGRLSEMKYVLRSCIHQLQGKARETLDLRYACDMRPQQIAQEMGVTSNVVSVLLHRVRAALRKCVEQKMGNTSGEAS